MRTLFWTVVVVCLITYIFSIFGVVLISSQVAAAHAAALDAGNASAEEIDTLNMLVECTGSVWAWMYTLIQVLTLDSWNGIARPLQSYVSGSWAFFYSYIAVAAVAQARSQQSIRALVALNRLTLNPAPWSIARRVAKNPKP
ncbi:Cacna1h [Symbiodinium natans]|uniref:Cacna1h protein n=1 Tax=Symbiodinium natans TaxID=878477 RepID=A0A812P545_9DINO|nr:Cacna1h [Symbiodinium natans]